MPELGDSPALANADDKLVALAPIRMPGNVPLPSLAMVRVAMRSPFPHVDKAEPVQVRALEVSLASACAACYERLACSSPL